MKSIAKWYFPLFIALLLNVALPQLAVAESATNEAVAVAPVNINTASAEELAAALVGVGPSKAAAIIAWREEFGGFKHIEELEEVKGIGPALMEKNKGRIAL